VRRGIFCPRAMEPTKSTPGRKQTNIWIFEGPAAFEEVGKADGFWNWAVAGLPKSADDLEILGGGRGGVNEMREAHTDLVNHFGLLRLSFGSGETCTTKWVYVRMHPRDDGSKGRTQSSAQAAEMAESMEKQISSYCHAPMAAAVDISSLEEFTVECFIKALVEASPDEAANFTVEAYETAVQEQLEACFVDEEDEEERETEQVLVDLMKEVPEPLDEESKPILSNEAAPPEPEPDEMLPTETELARQRKPLRLYGKGDYVQVLTTAGVWHDDGVIIAVIDEQGLHDGFRIPAGSMKAQYSGGRKFKWVTPLQAEEFLKASDRPRAPPPKLGNLYKETHNFFSEWHIRHFQLNKGFLLWWLSAEAARAGAKPNGVVSLLGLVCADKDTTFKLRTYSTKGVIYRFDASTQKECKEWIESLRKHADYVILFKEHMKAQRAGRKPGGKR